MNKIYFLSTCDTCARIIKKLGISSGNFKMQDIKTEPVTPAQLEEMKKMAGSYEALFSRVARKYQALGLNKKKLGEKDYHGYILEEYTFLKRPVIIINNKIFIGSSPKTIDAVKKEL